MKRLLIEYFGDNTMIISDLNHWQDVTETANNVRGADNFSIYDFQAQISDLEQYGFSEAKSTAQFGGAIAVSTVINTAEVNQVSL